MIKTTAFALLLVTGLSTFANAAETESKTNEFAITPVENLYLGKSINKVWNVAYSEKERPVTIILQQKGNEKEFVVRSEFFEIVYASNQNGFGVRKIKNSQREVPSQIISSVLNKQQLQNQRIITSNPISDDYALELIASYLPDLLNDGYKHLIF